jgi:acyl-CoA synthetase (AMP-forming)/AMP-acid ligase II
VSEGKLMGRVLNDVVALDPDRSALIIEGTATSYGELATAVADAAAGLRSAGAATALMNPRLTAGELEVLMEAAGTVATGVVGARFETVGAAAGISPLLGAAALLGRHANQRVETQEPEPDEDAVILFTSGTTGTPKAVPLTHGMVAPRITAFAPSVEPTPAVSIMCVPLVHIGGMLGLLVALAKGSTTVVQSRFDAGEWLALVGRHGVTTAFLVPTMLYRILEHPDFDHTDLSSLTSLSYGAAPASPELIRRTMAALPGVALTNTFGQTETMGSITALGPGDHPPERLASVGKPLPGVEIRIVHPTTGEDAPPGTVGELWVRSNVAVVQQPASGDDSSPPGWFRTGDMVSADEEGYLYPSGRLSDTINRGGEKFAPSEVEDVVHQHPAVRDVAAVGVIDSEMGHRVGVAVVVGAPLDIDELRTFCRGRIANFKQPERLLIVEELPLTDFGKVDRKRLRATFAETRR